MNTIALPERHPVQVSSVDHALSPEAEQMRTALVDVAREAESRTVTSWKKEALMRLGDALVKGVVSGWDGEGAVPVELSTYNNARQFIELLPADLPVPEIYPEPDGDIAFEWDLGRRRILSVSVGRDGTLHYAGLFGARKIHGVDFLGDKIPAAVWIGLAQLADPGR